MVLVQLKGFGREDVDDFVDGFLLQHQGTEHNFLKVGGLWRDTSLSSKYLVGSHQISFREVAERTARSGIVRHDFSVLNGKVTHYFQTRPKQFKEVINYL